MGCVQVEIRTAIGMSRLANSVVLPCVEDVAGFVNLGKVNLVVSACTKFKLYASIYANTTCKSGSKQTLTSTFELLLQNHT